MRTVSEFGGPGRMIHDSLGETANERPQRVEKATPRFQAALLVSSISKLWPTEDNIDNYATAGVPAKIT